MYRKFYESDTYTLTEDWHFAADDSRIALGQRDGTVMIFDRDGRETLRVDRVLADIALDKYLICLSGDTVSAYTHSEIELWTQTVEGATEITGVGANDVLIVLTINAEVVGLDIETGQQYFNTVRPHQDLVDTQVAGCDGLLCIGVWSFIIVVDTTGEILLNRNFNSAVQDVGILNNRVVAVLNSGEVVAFDVQTGKQRWSNSATVYHLCSCGQDTLVALTDTGAVLIHEEGRFEQVDIRTGETVCSSVDQTVLAVTDNKSVQIYRHGPPLSAQIDEELLTSKAGSTDPVRAQVENTGEEVIDTLVTLEFPSSSLEPQYTNLSLGPGDSREIEYQFDVTPPEGQLDCRLSVDDMSIAETRVSVKHTYNPTDAIDITASCSEIVGETAVVGVELENTTDTTIPQIVVDGENTGPISQDESVTVTREYSLDGTEKTVTVETADKSGGTTIEKQIPVPSEPIEIDILSRPNESGCVEVEVTPTTDATIDGELSISIDTETVVTPELSLSKDETLRLIIAPLEGVERRQPTVSVESPLLETARQRRLARGTVQGSDDNQHEAIQQLIINRDTPQRVQRGEAFDETIEVTNNSGRTLEGIAISGPDCEYSIATLESGEQTTVHREHALFDSGTHRLPELEIGDSSAEAKTVITQDDGLYFWAVITKEDKLAKLQFTCKNGTGNDCTIRSIGVDAGADMANTNRQIELRRTVRPGSSETFIRQAESPTAIDFSKDMCQVFLEYELNGKQAVRRTLALLESNNLGDNRPISLRPTGRTELVAGRRRIVEIAVQNNSEKTVTGTTLEITGEPVVGSESNRKSIRRLPPGGQAEIMFDVEPSHDGKTGLSVGIEGQIAGGSFTQQQRLFGPVAETTAEWKKQGYLKRWRETAITVPGRTRVATQFRSTETESPH